MTAAPLLLGRCNPYGAETGGPKRVLGGLYGPKSAQTPGMDLPGNVAEGEWKCVQPAVIRCRMICRCEHKGQVMQLCSWHDETSITTEMVAGTLRPVRNNLRIRGHYEEIQRRQAGLCPRCAYPPGYSDLAKEIQAWQAALYDLNALGMWNSEPARQLRSKIEGGCHSFDVAMAAGIVHRCPLRLVPVS